MSTTTSTRRDLPQSRGEVMLADGGLETTLIFDMGFDLPHFASFPLLDTDEGRKALSDYYRSYIEVALDQEVGIVLETPTWRASRDWGILLGYDEQSLDRVNAAAIELLRSIRTELEGDKTQIIVSGGLGPRGDGYEPGDLMSPDEAHRYHLAQIRSLAAAGADMVSILTVTNVEEAIGATRAAREAGIPITVSFTVETDGRLPTGQVLGDAIVEVDEDTGAYPLSFGINCAHPDHFSDVLESGGSWVERVGMVRANASRLSHDELDEAEELDSGDRAELGKLYRDLRGLLPNLTVMGGCCGTDHVHVAEIARACIDVPARSR